MSSAWHRAEGSKDQYWLRLEQDPGPGAVVRLANPNGSLAGVKGAQPWRPTRIPRLAPGETATLYAGLYTHLALPSRDWPSGPTEVGLRLASANAPPAELSLTVDLRLPSARWQAAVWDRRTETLEVSLSNSGKLPLGDARVSAEWWADGPRVDRSRVPDHRSAWLELPALEPGGVPGRLAFVLPDGERYLDQGALTLRVHTTDLPAFDWRLSAPRIERIGIVLWWLLIPV